MNIKYSKNKTKSFFYIKILLILNFIYLLTFSDHIFITSILLLLFVIVLMINNYLKISVNYFSISKGYLKFNNFYKNRIELSSITKIKAFAGDYILITPEKEYIIDTQIIDYQSLQQFNQELKSLNIEWI